MKRYMSIHRWPLTSQCLINAAVIGTSCFSWLVRVLHRVVYHEPLALCRTSGALPPVEIDFIREDSWTSWQVRLCSNDLSVFISLLIPGVLALVLSFEWPGWLRRLLPS